MTDEEIIEKSYLPDLDLPLWRAVELAAWRYACLHKIPLKKIEPVKSTIKEDYGYTWVRCGVIALRIRNRTKRGYWMHHPETGRELVDTLAHELAHLLAPDEEGHGRRWRLEFDELKRAMLEDGLDSEFDIFRKVA